jgi:protein O-mannosyl-transferase
MTRPGGRWSAALAVAALAALVALPSLLNQFVYDDVNVIVENRLVHSLASAPDIWTSSYWPAGGLYRPLTVQLWSVEWALGGGSPLLFHAVSILLVALAAVLVWKLASRLYAPPAPMLAGLIFAAHPVHVEAVANVVGQSELLAALFTLLAVERYLVWRGQGDLGARRRLALAGLTLLAIFSKETGYIAPVLILVAELTVFRPPRRIVTSVLGLQAGAVVAALLIRLQVLGSLAGETPAGAFRGLGVTDRATGMLAVVPEWGRLLFWPARLQGEYGPPALSVADPSTGAMVLGALLLSVALVAAVWSWRRRRTLAFALLWMGVALLPVSNVLAPTGVVLAERTLFLPSVGAVLLVGVVIGAIVTRATLPSGVRIAVVGLSLLLVSAAGLRSVQRAKVWRGQEVFFQALEQQAPRTYRAHYSASRYYYGERRFADAERTARRALELYRGDSNLHAQLGQVLRTVGRCEEAVPILAEGVTVDPDEPTVRSRLIECSLAIGDTARARRTAEEAVALGQAEFEQTLRRLR